MASVSDISTTERNAYRTPTARMRDLILETTHLETSEKGSESLATWLRGHGLPGIDLSHEPVVWLFRGLAALDEFDRPHARQQLSTWAATLIERMPVDHQPVDDRLIYNLFRLCAGLADPDTLAGHLDRMYRDRSLEGAYLGVDHRSGLRAALVFNQLDARLEDTWLAIVRQDVAVDLPGRPYHGFEGLLWMPDASDGRGHLATHSVLEALSVQIARLSDKLKRRDKLRVWFEAIQRVHANAACEIGVALIEAAQERQWPRWAVESMPMVARLHKMVAVS